MLRDIDLVKLHCQFVFPSMLLKCCSFFNLLMDFENNPEDEGVLPSDPKEYAVCPHGPMLLFRKRKNGRHYYACSATRDRKMCPFFLYEEKKPSATTLQVWKSEILKQQNLPKSDDQSRLKKTKSMQRGERRFCQEIDCSLFVMPNEISAHANHHIIQSITDAQMKRPTELLQLIVDPKSNAQFIFEDKSADFLVTSLEHLGFHNVICIGAPKIHERLHSHSKFKSYLLDIDFRFQNFYTKQSFARFNMFNGHFFSSCRDSFSDFLSSCDATCPPAILIDPPFGGLVQPLVAVLKQISTMWAHANKVDLTLLHDSKHLLKNEESASDPLLPVIWAFPYFLETAVKKELPHFQMLDYKVSYKNHALFQSGLDKKDGSAAKKESPIRLFTNILPSVLKLPEDENYRWCAGGCNRWVAPENQHCNHCGSCTSKDGSTYKHCDLCKKCVKPTRIHCDKCERCEFADHFCEAKTLDSNEENEVKGDGMETSEVEEVKERCFSCGVSGHKRRHCPLIWKNLKGKRKRNDGSGGVENEDVKRLKMKGQNAGPKKGKAKGHKGRAKKAKQ